MLSDSFLLLQILQNYLYIFIQTVSKSVFLLLGILTLFQQLNVNCKIKLRIFNTKKAKPSSILTSVLQKNDQ